MLGSLISGPPTRSLTPGHARMAPLLCSRQKLLGSDLDTDVQQGDVIPRSQDADLVGGSLRMKRDRKTCRRASHP